MRGRRSLQCRGGAQDTQESALSGVHIFVETVDRADRYARIQRWTAYGAVALAVLAGLFLAILTFVAHQACSGMSHAPPVCHTVPGGQPLRPVQTHPVGPAP